VTSKATIEGIEGGPAAEAVSKLTGTIRGKILLVNVYDLVRSNLLDPKNLRLALRGMRMALRKAPNPCTEDELISHLSLLRNSMATKFQAIASERPGGHVTIAAIRSFDDIKPMLFEIEKVHKVDRRVRAALAPRPPAEVIRAVAGVINEYIPKMPTLALGIPFNLFWATTIDAVRTLEREASESGQPIGELIRNYLGLGHVQPDGSGRARHLFVFEGLRPLGEMQPGEGFRIARPTTIDGFDNPRFRQSMGSSTQAVSGCGLTVKLGEPHFADGAPELVSTKIPLKGNFSCRWIGEVASRPPGNDHSFLEFLRSGRSLDEIGQGLMSRSPTAVSQ
jgi:hypothetical protein